MMSFLKFKKTKKIAEKKERKKQRAGPNLLKIFNKLQLLPVGTNFLDFFLLFFNFSSWIRIRILNADMDPDGKINGIHADPDPQH